MLYYAPKIYSNTYRNSILAVIMMLLPAHNASGFHEINAHNSLRKN